MRHSPFGYDYSEVLNLEVELREKASKHSKIFYEPIPLDIGKELVSRLSNVTDPVIKRKGRLTFDEWKRKKTTEARLKRHLIEESLK